MFTRKQVDSSRHINSVLHRVIKTKFSSRAMSTFFKLSSVILLQALLFANNLRNTTYLHSEPFAVYESDMQTSFPSFQY